MPFAASMGFLPCRFGEQGALFEATACRNFFAVRNSCASPVWWEAQLFIRWIFIVKRNEDGPQECPSLFPAPQADRPHGAAYPAQDRFHRIRRWLNHQLLIAVPDEKYIDRSVCLLYTVIYRPNGLLFFGVIL